MKQEVLKRWLRREASESAGVSGGASRRRWRRIVVLGVVGLVLLLWARWSLERVVPTVQGHLFVRQVEKHGATLRAAADESGVDAYLLAAIMCAESSGRVDARSGANALGLFQLRMPTAVERAGKLGLPAPAEEDLLSDGLLNARLGANYFSWLLGLYDGDVQRCLVAYNLGPTRLARYVREAGSWEAWREEREDAGDSDLLAYAQKVMSLRDQFREKELLQ